MATSYYILKNGRLRRQDNTLYLETSEEKRPIPIEDIDAIYAYGELDLNSKLLVFLSQKQIPLHVFNYYGYYSGTYYPREYLNSGFLLVKQVEHYLNEEKRLELAKAFAQSAGHNILRVLRYYENREKPLTPHREEIKQILPRIALAQTVPEVMGLEGHLREKYYATWAILLPEMPLEKRERRPPTNPINTLISFGNSLLYATCVTEIYRTQLNPTISYLHEPGARRFSLALDLAEIFKPLLVDRLIFHLIHRKQIGEDHFVKELNNCLLNEKGRRLFLQEWEKRLETTIHHRRLNRSVSYRRLIRLECYKLIKHLTGMETYEGFKAWW